MRQLDADFASADPNSYTSGAVANLFYWNNILHDVHYHFGFDEACFYLRLDPAPGLATRLASTTIELHARTRAGARRFVAERGHYGFAPQDPPPPVDDVPPIGEAIGPEAAAGPLGRVACHDVLEIAFPFAAIGALPGDRVEVSLRLREDEVILVRLPRDGHLELRVPDDHFDADHWML